MIARAVSRRSLSAMFRTKFNPALLGLLPAAFIFASAGIHAQTPPVNSTQPLPTPAQTSAAPVVPLNPALPTVFIVGDSTAHNQADLGWGDYLAHYFDTTRINVANRAIAGRRRGASARNPVLPITIRSMSLSAPALPRAHEPKTKA